MITILPTVYCVCMCAVSYTHLDVYKRQVEIRQAMGIDLHVIETIAVSYTHLDVYKRQHH